MKKRYTEEQIIKALKQNEAGSKVDDICRDLGISSGTFYNWRTTFYRWYERYRRVGQDALQDKTAQATRVWNRIPDAVRDRLITLVLDRPELSPRELAEDRKFKPHLSRISKVS